MIKYNYAVLKQIKKEFKWTNADIKRITGLKSITSVYYCTSGQRKLTTDEITAICNATEEIAYKKHEVELKIYKPNDFWITDFAIRLEDE